MNYDIADAYTLYEDHQHAMCEPAHNTVTVVTRSNGERQLVMHTATSPHHNTTFYFVVSGGMVRRVMSDSVTITHTETITSTEMTRATVRKYAEYTGALARLQDVRRNAQDNTHTLEYYHDGTQYTKHIDYVVSTPFLEIANLYNQVIALRIEVLAYAKLAHDELNDIGYVA